MRKGFGAAALLVAIPLAATLLGSGSLQAGPAKVGDTVWAQWKPNDWYHGKAERACPLGLHVVFDDGDSLCVHASLIAVDAPLAAADKGPAAGARVLAIWSDGRYYPATVRAAAKDGFDVVYDDRAAGKVAAKDLRVLPQGKPAKTAAAGEVVWAQWGPNAWYHGKVDKPCEAGGLHVRFDDGDDACLAPILVAVDAAPAKDAIKPAARVLGRWKDGHLYPATVIGADGVSFEVRYDDGASGSVPLADLRHISD